MYNLSRGQKFHKNLALNRLLNRSLWDRSDMMHRRFILNTFRRNLSRRPQNAFPRATIFHQCPAFIKSLALFLPIYQSSANFLPSSQRSSSFNLLLHAPIFAAVLHHRQSLAEVLTDRFQVFRVQMQACQRSLVTSAEAALHGVTSAI